jgi:hypothetical protein
MKKNVKMKDIRFSWMDVTFRGAEVEFLISFVSCPVYMTIPNIHDVLRSIAPLNNNWSGPNATDLEFVKKKQLNIQEKPVCIGVD